MDRSILDVDFEDDWIKAARKKPKHKPREGDEGLFPKPLSTAQLQYNLRQIPQRGMAELLQSYRTDYWLHRVIDIIARRFSVVPWSLYDRPAARGSSLTRGKISKNVHGLRGEPRDKYVRKALDTGELKEIEDHPLLTLLHTPNPLMSGVTFRDLCCKYLDLQGEVFIYKRRDSLDIVYELWPLSPTWIYRVPTGDMPFFDISVLGKTLRVPAQDMCWFKHLELLNPYTRGSGQGESLGSLIDSNHYLLQFQKSFFYNDARPNMFIWLEGADETTVRDFQDKLENTTRGPLRKNRPVIYDGPKQAAITEVDLSHGIGASIPLLDKVRDTFVSVFGVPPEIAGVLTSSNRATIDAAEDMIGRNTIQPRCEFWLDEMTRQLVGPEFGEDILLGFENPIPEDKAKKLEVMKTAPWIADVGEWRELAGLPSRGKEDEFYMVPVNYVPTPDASQQAVQITHRRSEVVGEPTPGASNLAAGNQSGLGMGSGTVEQPSGGVARPDGERADDGAGQSPPSIPMSTAQRFYDDTFQPPPDDSQSGAKLSGKKKALSLSEGLKAVDRWVKAADIDEVVSALDPEALTKELDPLWKAKVEQWGQQALQDVGADVAFDMHDPTVSEHLRAFAGDRIGDLVDDTTRDALRETLAEGVDAGEGIDDLAARVKEVFDVASTSRAEAIARTETMRSSNFALMAGYKQSGLVDSKEWVATQDDRTRDDHAWLGEQDPIPIDEPFKLDDMEADQPGDFGEPEQDINCRCTVAPVVASIEDLEGDEEKALAPEKVRLDRGAVGLLWKRFDAHARAWEQEAASRLKKGFTAQQTVVLSALRRKF